MISPAEGFFPRRPFADTDLELIAEAVGAEQIEAVFHGNAEALYLGGHNT